MFELIQCVNSHIIHRRVCPNGIFAPRVRTGVSEELYLKFLIEFAKQLYSVKHCLLAVDNVDVLNVTVSHDIRVVVFGLLTEEAFVR